MAVAKLFARIIEPEPKKPNGGVSRVSKETPACVLYMIIFNPLNMAFKYLMI
jgi:hypothetical protein